MNANRTGAQGPLELVPDGATRKIMELMGKIIEGSVNVNPETVASAGEQNEST